MDHLAESGTRKALTNVSYFHDFLCGPQNKETEEEGKKWEELGNTVSV